jgi:hypothetical protein
LKTDFIHIEKINQFIDNLLIGIEGALASFFHSALGFSPTLFLDLPKFIIFQCFSLKKCDFLGMRPIDNLILL